MLHLEHFNWSNYNSFLLFFRSAPSCTLCYLLLVSQLLFNFPFCFAKKKNSEFLFSTSPWITIHFDLHIFTHFKTLNKRFVIITWLNNGLILYNIVYHKFNRLNRSQRNHNENIERLSWFGYGLWAMGYEIWVKSEKKLEKCAGTRYYWNGQGSNTAIPESGEWRKITFF